MTKALEQVDTFKDQLQEKNDERTKLEQMIQEMQAKHQETEKALQESLIESNQSLCTLELLSR